jgi:hypothetical protein
MGGFSGQDDVVSAEDFSTMVSEGELRYVLFSGERGGKQEIAAWLNNSCSIIPQFSIVNASGPRAPQGGGGPLQVQSRTDSRNQQTSLYLCQ